MSTPTCCCHNGNTVACCTKGRSTNISGNLALQGNPFRTTTQTALFPFCRSPHEQQMCLAGFLLWGIPTSDCGGFHSPNWRCVERPAAPAPFAAAHTRTRASWCDRASRTATLRWRTHLYITKRQTWCCANSHSATSLRCLDAPGPMWAAQSRFPAHPEQEEDETSRLMLISRRGYVSQ
jgi:hypothetical protein